MSAFMIPIWMVTLPIVLLMIDQYSTVGSNFMDDGEGHDLGACGAVVTKWFAIK